MKFDAELYRLFFLTVYRRTSGSTGTHIWESNGLTAPSMFYVRPTPYVQLLLYVTTNEDDPLAAAVASLPRAFLFFSVPSTGMYVCIFSPSSPAPSPSYPDPGLHSRHTPPRPPASPNYGTPPCLSP